eukprot:TRINITY_DN4298_c0_g1_i14.p1 TRINITY_DN4298_c0_g1~~TRINITY_DN4298_c0_g1_i14.p1  ORF type:complete len:354 (-),score=21.75 TRINITY_DN4298_c0_g1_i14:934-1995(-)
MTVGLQKTGDQIMVKCKANVKGKVAIITGASSGIGKATAQCFAKFGARVIAGCKEESSGLAAIQDIKKVLNCEAEVEFSQLDLSSFEQIQEFANRIIETEQRVDYLVLNAAISQCPKMQTREGFEMQWGVNHLGHFYLVQLLLPFLRAQEQGVRIVIVTCPVYSQGRISFSDPNGVSKSYDSYSAFKQSKLANTIFGVELSKRLQGTSIQVQIVNPGIVDTNISRYVPIMGSVLKAFLAPFLPTPAQGCGGVIMACVDQSLCKKAGYFIDNLVVKKLQKIALGENSGKALWKLSEAQVRGAKVNSFEPAALDPVSIIIASAKQTFQRLLSGQKRSRKSSKQRSSKQKFSRYQE